MSLSYVQQADSFYSVYSSRVR